MGFFALAASAAAQSALFPLDHFWTHELEAPFAAPLASDGRRVFVPVQTGQIIALDTATNVVAWSAELTTPSAPLAAEGRLFVEAGGALQALDGATGALRWRLPVSELAVPVVYRAGWLIVAMADGAIQAVRAADGVVLWAHDAGSPAAASPAIDGNLLVVPLADGRILAMDLPGGRPLWSRPIGAVPSGVTISGDRVFAGAEDGMFWALGARDGDLDWRWRIGARLIGAPAADADGVYAVAVDNVVRGFSRRSGNQRWSRPLTTRALAGPLLFDGILVVTTGEVGRPGLTYIEARTGAAGGTTPPLPTAAETMRVQYPVVITSAPTSRAFIATATPGGDWALHGYQQTFLRPTAVGPVALGPKYEIRLRLDVRTGVVVTGTRVPLVPQVPRVP